MAYNSVVRDSLVVGWSANAEVDFFFNTSVRSGIRSAGGYTSGLRVYDGPLQVDLGMGDRRGHAPKQRAGSREAVQLFGARVRARPLEHGCIILWSA